MSLNRCVSEVRQTTAENFAHAKPRRVEDSSPGGVFCARTRKGYANFLSQAYT